MKASLLALVVLLAGAAPAASAQVGPGDQPDPSIADGSAQRKLNAARERWQAASVASYSFRIGVSCFCPADYRRKRTLVVRRGRPVDPPPNLRSLATVPRMFRYVQEAIDDEVSGLDVRYSRRGLPLGIAVDGSTAVADDEIAYAIDRFTVRR